MLPGGEAPVFLFRLPLLRSLTGAALVAGGVVAAALVARGRLAEAAALLVDQRPLPLLAAALCAPLVPAATAAAWRSVLASSGVRLTVGQAWGCYGLGSLANTFLPGRIGDALRIELFSRRLRHPRKRWLACGVSTTVGLAQSVVLGVVLGLGSLTGALPLWAIAPSLAFPAVMVGAGRVALRRRPDGRVACLATASTLSPAAWGRLLAWVGAGALARLLVAASVLDALSAQQPMATAIVAVCGLAIGNALPFAPGGAGVAAATMSVALGQAGLDTSTAVAAAMSFHAFETAAGLLFGTSAWILLKAGRRARLPEPDASLVLAAARAA